MNRPLTVCYMGLTKPDFSRNGVQIAALRKAGVTVHECFDQSRGLLKFWRLFRAHAKVGKYDALIVGCPSALLAPLAWLIKRGPLIFDAGWTLYEGEVLARKKYRRNPFMRWWLWSIDRTAYALSDLVLTDSDIHKATYARCLRVDGAKLRRLYTGCNEDVFFADPDVQKRGRFTAVFRGKYNIEAGLPHVLAAGRLLSEDDIDLMIYSPGYDPKQEERTPNITIVNEFFSPDELRRRIGECHVSIGQMDRNERLDHTIPHKAFESLVMEVPYIAARAKVMEELLCDGESCLMVEAGNPEALRTAIRRVRDEKGLRGRLVAGGLRVYREKASWEVIARDLTAHISELRAPR